MWNAGKPRVGAAEASIRPVRSSQEDPTLVPTVIVSAPFVALTRPAELLPSTPILSDPILPAHHAGSLGTTCAGPNPYGAFQRRFTEEGGIEFTFLAKDDRAWWWWLRFGLWVTGMGGLAAAMVLRMPDLPPVAGALIVVAVGWISWLALFRDDGHACTIEVRPDCFIVDGTDIFWRDYMELGPAILESGPDEGLFRFVGTYGTRRMEYCRLHTFDENDRAPQVFFSHVQFAMQKLWAMD